MESLWGRRLEMPKAYDFINKLYIKILYLQFSKISEL